MAKKKTGNSTAETTLSCLDCRHLVATIPVFQAQEDGKLLYDKAPVRCRLGHLTYCKGGGHKIFKRILARLSIRAHRAAVKNMAAWREAERCPDYESMDDESTD